MSQKVCQSLRAGIANKEIDADVLVNMTSEDMATQEQKYAREQAFKEHSASRDLDWEKKNRDKIFQANGLDPNAGGEFVCRKCKGTKTIHNAAQTRSSDEPMTIFVTCLTCNNHWRC